MIKFISLNDVKAPIINLICFHWVGGGAASFKEIAKIVEPKQIKVHGLILPGRNGRDTDQIIKRMEDVVRWAKKEIEQVKDLLSNAPIIFFGHSFGGLLAFELVRAMHTEGSPIQVARLIVSAVHSPSILTVKNQDPYEVSHHLQSDAELFSYVKSIGGK